MSRKRRGGHGGHSSSERWLLTYADMITLLLALFIVMYAMSEVSVKKMDELSKSLSTAFHTGGGSTDPLPPASKELLSGAGALLPEEKRLMDMQEKIEQEVMAKHGAEAAANVTTSLTQRGLVVSLSNSAFFGAGEAELRPEAVGVLQTVAGFLKSSGRQIMVEGHTDNTPIHTVRYPSNWELSTARATTVVRWLIERYSFQPRRLSAAGYGEYYPLVRNNTAANQAKNRRVDLVILRSDLKGQRPGGMM
jgi:chemotaxis protein MotB